MKNQIAKLKKDQLLDHRKNEDLRKKMQALKGVVSVMSIKKDNMSTMDTMERMMSTLKKELSHSRTVK